MIQLSPDSQVHTFRLILEMENRGQQIDGIFVRLKQAFIQNGGSVSIPDAVGALDELGWHVAQIRDSAAELESTIGIQRTPVTVKPKTDESHEVERLRGTTATLPLADLLAVLAEREQTGTLKIRARHGECFLLEFLDGAVVHAASDTPLPNQLLGNILVARDRLCPERLKQFLVDFAPSDGPIGQALAQAELVSEDDLREALSEQVRRLFQRIYELDDATFCFTTGTNRDLELRATVNTAMLLDSIARTEEADDVPELDELEIISEPHSTSTCAEIDASLDAEQLCDVLGIRRNAARELILRDLDSIDGIRIATDLELLEVPGIGMKTLARIREAVPAGFAQLR